MQQMSERPPAQGSRRRPPRPRSSVVQNVSIHELERLLEVHERAVRTEIDEGLRSLYGATIKLMRQVAAEAWRAGGPGADDRFRDRIVSSLARDEALRALLGQADERHQALRLRVERIERAIRHLITANRAAIQAGQPNGKDHAGTELLARAGSLAAEVARAGASQQRQLEAFVGRAAEQLAQAAGAARRREERMERRLGELASSVEALTRAWETVPRGAPPGRSGAIPRLRALERRLARISGDLAAMDRSGR